MTAESYVSANLLHKLEMRLFLRYRKYHFNLCNLLPPHPSQMGVCEPLSLSLAEEPLLPCDTFNWDATVEIGVAGTHRDSYFYLTPYTFNLKVNEHAKPLCLDTQHDASTTYLSFSTFTSIFLKIACTSYLAEFFMWIYIEVQVRQA